MQFIPVASGGRRRNLQEASEGESIFAWEDGNFDLTVTLDVTDSTSGLSCSFQGGCSYTVTAAGLTASFLADSETNFLDVCGQNCVIDADNSDAN